jgi:hypothetical protein
MLLTALLLLAAPLPGLQAHRMIDPTEEAFTKHGMMFVNGMVSPMDTESYLTERTEHYADIVETLAAAPYASDLFTTCTYYDQCRSDNPGVTNESLAHFPSMGIAVNESISATKLLDGKCWQPTSGRGDDGTSTLIFLHKH